jgi:hypothetical protein
MYLDFYKIWQSNIFDFHLVTATVVCVLVEETGHFVLFCSVADISLQTSN